MHDAESDRDLAIPALIDAAERDRGAYRYPSGHTVLAVLPDWLYAELTGQDREDLLARDHILVRSHTEVYGEEESA